MRDVPLTSWRLADAQIKDAKYLGNFVNEVMRLRPPTPQTARVATVDVSAGPARWRLCH